MLQIAWSQISGTAEDSPATILGHDKHMSIHGLGSGVIVPRGVHPNVAHGEESTTHILA